MPCFLWCGFIAFLLIFMQFSRRYILLRDDIRIFFVGRNFEFHSNDSFHALFDCERRGWWFWDYACAWCLDGTASADILLDWLMKRYWVAALIRILLKHFAKKPFFYTFSFSISFLFATWGFDYMEHIKAATDELCRRMQHTTHFRWDDVSIAIPRHDGPAARLFMKRKKHYSQ